MGVRDKVREGMQVYGSDDQMVGIVESVRQRGLQVGGRAISLSEVARVSGNRVYLTGVGAGYMAPATGTVETAQVSEGDIRVPVIEERLAVTKRQVEQGEVRIHKTVTNEQVMAPIELRREEVHLERHDIQDRPIDPATMTDAFKEDTIRVSVRGEEAIVTKQAFQTGEVVIDKEQMVERQEITDTVRRERVEIDEDRQTVSASGQQPLTERRTAPADHIVAEAEPKTRTTLEEIEPELRERQGPARAAPGSS